MFYSLLPAVARGEFQSETNPKEQVSHLNSHPACLKEPRLKKKKKKHWERNKTNKTKNAQHIQYVDHKKHLDPVNQERKTKSNMKSNEEQASSIRSTGLCCVYRTAELSQLLLDGRATTAELKH